MLHAQTLNEFRQYVLLPPMHTVLQAAKEEDANQLHLPLPLHNEKSKLGAVA